MPTLDGFIRNPHRYFNMARMVSPVLWVNLFQVKGWLVTGYEETEAILRDPRFIKERAKVIPPSEQVHVPEHIGPAYEVPQKMLLFRDAPDHTRLRSLVMKAFPMKMIERLRPVIEATCDELLASRKGLNRHELIAEFAYPLPVLIIASLLGVPPEDAHLFREWSAQFVRIIDLNSTMDDWEEVAPVIMEFRDYFRALIEVKRANPQEDLLSGLIAAEEREGKLTMDEVISTCMMLLLAGHETTVNLIANGYYRLLKNPGQYRMLQDDPSLIGSALEEILRYDPPVLLTSRWVSEDLKFAGKSMKRGQILMLALGAANRDRRVTKKPKVFDITRSPNRHLSFSSGAHYCLGAPLGRLEAEIALSKLIRHFHRPVLLEEPKWRPSIVIRGFEILHLQAETM